MLASLTLSHYLFTIRKCILFSLRKSVLLLGNKNNVILLAPFVSLTNLAKLIISNPKHIENLIQSTSSWINLLSDEKFRSSEKLYINKLLESFRVNRPPFVDLSSQSEILKWALSANFTNPSNKFDYHKLLRLFTESLNNCDWNNSDILNEASIFNHVQSSVPEISLKEINFKKYKHITNILNQTR